MNDDGCVAMGLGQYDGMRGLACLCTRASMRIRTDARLTQPAEAPARTPEPPADEASWAHVPHVCDDPPPPRPAPVPPCAPGGFRLFWGYHDVEPSLELSGTANLVRMVRDSQLGRLVDTYPALVALQGGDVLEDPGHAQFHDFRKLLR